MAPLRLSSCFILAVTGLDLLHRLRPKCCSVSKEPPEWDFSPHLHTSKKLFRRKETLIPKGQSNHFSMNFFARHKDTSRKRCSFCITRKCPLISRWAEQSHASKRSESFGPLAGKKIKANLNYTVFRIRGRYRSLFLTKNRGSFYSYSNGLCQRHTDHPTAGAPFVILGFRLGKRSYSRVLPLKLKSCVLPSAKCIPFTPHWSSGNLSTVAFPSFGRATRVRPSEPSLLVVTVRQ